MLQTVDAEKILDVGCGEGVTLDKIYRKGIGRHLEGIDFFKTAIDIGKKHFPHITLKQADVYKLPYKDNSFDVVLCNEVLEHLERPHDAIDEMKRVSSKYLLLSVPNEPFFMGANFLRGRHVSRLGNHPEHIQHWTFYSFQKFVENHGMRVVQKKYPFAWTMILAEKTKNSR